MPFPGVRCATPGLRVATPSASKARGATKRYGGPDVPWHDLAVAAGQAGGREPDRDRLAEEPHRPVAEREVRPAGVERVNLLVVPAVHGHGAVRARAGGLARQRVRRVAPVELERHPVVGPDAGGTRLVARR